ncbi:hypothetical protein VFPPC_09510 [Pochonia chlamydosporia 170]|uniref:Uncharacterized protein n=1 Tax=Pochonia chlamydosporia 170 TaxID=1380566 RepID=A0A179F8E7_METCM|nr:hypothetical protein VFPPC_09510 [Pochonia chlamydosporia 170]OAQ61706.1 hypothetical protein VFPPC_09510 [Pochonia chlamydosporia 170]
MFACKTDMVFCLPYHTCNSTPTETTGPQSIFDQHHQPVRACGGTRDMSSAKLTARVTSREEIWTLWKHYTIVGAAFAQEHRLGVKLSPRSANIRPTVEWIESALAHKARFFTAMPRCSVPTGPLPNAVDIQDFGV